MGTLLIGYDVEWRGDGEVTPRFLEQARSLHNRLGVPATLVRRRPDTRALGAAVSGHRRRPALRHPAAHLLPSTPEDGLHRRWPVGSRRAWRHPRGDARGGAQDHARSWQSTSASQCIRTDRTLVLLPGTPRSPRHPAGAVGGRHPLHPHRRPQRARLASRSPSICSPIGTTRSGFPDVLEIPIHGWHDCVIRDEVLGWENLDGYVESVRPYIDRAAAEDKVFSLVPARLVEHPCRPRDARHRSVDPVRAGTGSPFHELPLVLRSVQGPPGGRGERNVAGNGPPIATTIATSAKNLKLMNLIKVMNFWGRRRQ